MKTIQLVCAYCKKTFTRSAKEYNRSTKLNRKPFCSLSCAGFANQKTGTKNLGKYLGNTELLIKGSEKDEYSPFRYFHKLIRYRHKEKNYQKTDITLLSLKELWEKQKGICPVTGLEMELPLGSSGWNRSKKNPLQASLDRIEAHKPYMQGNVRFIVFIANMCKHEFTDQDIYNFAEAIMRNRTTIA